MKEKFRICLRWHEYIIEKKFLLWWLPYIEYDWEHDMWFWFWYTTFDEAEDWLKQIVNKRSIHTSVIQEYEFNFDKKKHE